jgi:MFS transporter, DHA2 family, methylenomycin A resistance protein
VTSSNTRTLPATPRRAATWPQTATLIAASLGFAVIQLDVTVVNVAVKQIGATFGGGVTQLQWVVSAYTLMFAALILTAGSLGDRFGARRVLCAGFAVFVTASMACGLAPGIAALIAARAVQGIGAALLGSCSLALINQTFPDPGRRARAIGQWAAGASAALSGGPVLGGILIATLGWRSIFFINGPIGLSGLWLAWRYAPRTPGATHRRMDLGGALTAITALAAFATAVIEAGAYGFTSPWVLGALALSLLAAAAFIRTQARAADPMLPLALFRKRRFVSPVAIGFLVNVCFYGLLFLFSLLFQDHDGMSALQAGLAFLPMTAAILSANLLSGRISAAVGPAGAILIGLAAMAAGCAGLLPTGPATAYPAMLAQQILLGGGLGLLVPPLTGLLLSSAERSRSGVASGALTAFRQAGSLLGVALFGSLASHGHFYTGLRSTLWISVAILITSAALTRLPARSSRVTAGHLPGGSRPRLDGQGGHPLELISACAVAGRLGDPLQHRAGVAGKRRRVSVRGQDARVDVSSDALLVDCDVAVTDLPELLRHVDVVGVVGRAQQHAAARPTGPRVLLGGLVQYPGNGLLRSGLLGQRAGDPSAVADAVGLDYLVEQRFLVAEGRVQAAYADT